MNLKISHKARRVMFYLQRSPWKGACGNRLVFATGSKMEQAPIKIVPVDNDDHAAGGDASPSVHYLIQSAVSIATV